MLLGKADVPRHIATMEKPILRFAQPAAALVALVGFAALAGQFRVTRATTGAESTLLSLWLMAGYFTVLVNVLLVLHFAGLAIGLRQPGKPGSATAALVLSITVVGIVYHTLLSGLWSLDGLAWWADQGLHSAMPVLAILWWLVFAPKAGLTVRDLAGWLVLPFAYCLYAVGRGAMTGFWAYPFLDPRLHGAAGVAVNIGAMVVGFALLGLGMLAFSRRPAAR